MTVTLPSLGRRFRLSQLQVLDQVLATGSILRAAQALGLSQPGVTRIVHELEAHFGLPLLVRGNRGVTPTEFGRRMGRRARRLLTELRDMSEEAAAFTTGSLGQVTVGTLVAASTTLLPQAVARLKQHAPQVRVTIRIGEMPNLLASLSAGDLDLIVARVPEASLWHHTHPELAAEILMRDALCVVGGGGHPLASRRSLSLRALANHPWILPTPESPFRGTVDALFQRHGMSTPVNVVESLSMPINLSLLSDGHTVTFSSRSVARPFMEAGMLAALPVRLDVDFGGVGMLRRVDAVPGPAVQRLVEHLREAVTGA